MVFHCGKVFNSSFHYRLPPILVGLQGRLEPIATVLEWRQGYTLKKSADYFNPKLDHSFHQFIIFFPLATILNWRHRQLYVPELLLLRTLFWPFCGKRWTIVCRKSQAVKIWHQPTVPEFQTPSLKTSLNAMANGMEAPHRQTFWVGPRRDISSSLFICFHMRSRLGTRSCTYCMHATVVAAIGGEWCESDGSVAATFKEPLSQELTLVRPTVAGVRWKFVRLFVKQHSTCLQIERR